MIYVKIQYSEHYNLCYNPLLLYVFICRRLGVAEFAVWESYWIEWKHWTYVIEVKETGWQWNLSEEEYGASVAVHPCCKHNDPVLGYSYERLDFPLVRVLGNVMSWGTQGLQLRAKGTCLDLVFWRVFCSKQARRVLQETWHRAMVRVTGLAQCSHLPCQASAASGLKGHICISKWSIVWEQPCKWWPKRE